MAARDDLLQAMETYSKEIGVANYLADAYIDGDSRPGDIAIWIARFQPENLLNAKDKLVGLLEVYTTIAESKPKVDNFKNLSDGEGAVAFGTRWDSLINHTKGNGNITGLYGYLEQLRLDMDDLVEKIENMQARCAENLAQLDGLRDAYCNALIDVAIGESDQVMAAIIAGGGTGATFGSAAGGEGVVFGAVIGGLIGFISSVNADNSAAVDQVVSSLDTAGVEGSVSVVASTLAEFLNPRRYGPEDGIKKWTLLGDDLLEGEWSD